MKHNIISHACLSVGLGLTLASAAYGQFTPAPLTPASFTQDVVVEKNGPRPVIPGGVTTATVDEGIREGGDTWNEQGYFLSDPSVGIPRSGTSFTTNNHTFTMAPSYTANNAIMMDAGFFTNTDFTLANPAPYAGLSFLTSGGNGGCQFRWTVSRQDGTTDTGLAASADWFNVAQNIAWIANGRVHAQNFTLDNYNSQNPRLYSIDVPVAASSSPITKINIQYGSGSASGHSAILAISGASTAGGAYTPILGTGYNADIVVEATAPRRWDLDPVTAASTASMDGGLDNTGNTWFEQGYYSVSNSFGLPASGTTMTAATASDHQFQMAPSYAANNAVFLDPSTTTASITLANPAAFTALSFLTASANGSMNIEAVVHHQDGSTEPGTVSSSDWFGGASIALTSNGRINLDSGIFGDLDSGNPRVYFADFLLANAASPVTSVDLTYTNTDGRSVIFALSGSTGPVRPVITGQPAGVKTNTGGSAVLSVIAAGTPPLSYQWQRGTNDVFVNLADGGNISGATSAAISISSLGDADLADYRAVVANAAGSSTSAVATVLVLSALPDVTAPTDSITSVGGTSPDAENVSHVIDNDTAKYLNRGSGANPLNIPVGFIVTPAAGRTIVTAMRFYTANDGAARDPANYILEGSSDGGFSYTLISSNSLTMPDARNNGGAAIDPLTQAIAQVRFANTIGYSTYRVTFTKVKGATDLFQIGEVELLGVVDTSGFPNVTVQPRPVTVFAGGNAQFSVTATGTPTTTYQWRKGGNGVYANIAGATSSTLSLNNVSFADAAQYQVVVKNSAGELQSVPAPLRVLSTATDVTQPSDVIAGFGDQSGTFWNDATNASLALDGFGAKWQNGGSGFSAEAGFPPFQGPVGLVVTPSAGPTILSGLRIYTGEANPERDPAVYLLEGSADGTSYQVISGGALDLPDARNAADATIDPLTSGLQEILFGNNRAFTSYRITFNNTRNDSTANSLQIGEVELLGVSVPAVSPTLSISRSANGSLILTSSAAGTLQSTTAFLGASTTWQTEGAISGSVTIPAAQLGQSKFYRVSVP